MLHATSMSLSSCSLPTKEAAGKHLYFNFILLQELAFYNFSNFSAPYLHGIQQINTPASFTYIFNHSDNALSHFKFYTQPGATSPASETTMFHLCPVD